MAKIFEVTLHFAQDEETEARFGRQDSAALPFAKTTAEDAMFTGVIVAAIGDFFLLETGEALLLEDDGVLLLET